MKSIYHFFLEEIEKYNPGLSHQLLLALLILKIIMNNIAMLLNICLFIQIFELYYIQRILIT